MLNELLGSDTIIQRFVSVIMYISKHKHRNIAQISLDLVFNTFLKTNAAYRVPEGFEKMHLIPAAPCAGPAFLLLYCFLIKRPIESG